MAQLLVDRISLLYHPVCIDHTDAQKKKAGKGMKTAMDSFNDKRSCISDRYLFNSLPHNRDF